MAGHSKWANIKHRKARQDASKGKVFTKLIRELVTASKLGDADPASNPRLRAAVEKALAANMTRDVVNRAIARGQGPSEGENVQEITYEGYGVGGVAVLIETMTDNLNRTVPDIRHCFSKTGGNLGTNGSVAYLFSKCAEVVFADPTLEEQVLEIALEIGVDDVETSDDNIVVSCAPELFGALMDAFNAAGLRPVSAEVTMRASMQAEITDLDQAKKVVKLIEMLEDLDDVQNVYTNAQIDPALMAEL